MASSSSRSACSSGREHVDEVRGPPVVGVRLPVRLEGGGPARGDQRVLTHDLVLPGGLGVMDDLGRVSARGQQRAEHVRVKPPARRGRYRRQDGVAGQLVPEAQVPVVELERAGAAPAPRPPPPTRA